MNDAQIKRIWIPRRYVSIGINVVKDVARISVCPGRNHEGLRDVSSIEVLVHRFGIVPFENEFFFVHVVESMKTIWRNTALQL